MATLTTGQLRMTWFMPDGTPPHTTHDTIDYLPAPTLQQPPHYPWQHLRVVPPLPRPEPSGFLGVFWGGRGGLPLALEPWGRKVCQNGPATLRKVGQNFGVGIRACLNRGGAPIKRKCELQAMCINSYFGQSSAFCSELSSQLLFWKWHDVYLQ